MVEPNVLAGLRLPKATRGALQFRSFSVAAALSASLVLVLLDRGGKLSPAGSRAWHPMRNDSRALGRGILLFLGMASRREGKLQ